MLIWTYHTRGTPDVGRRSISRSDQHLERSILPRLYIFGEMMVLKKKDYYITGKLVTIFGWYRLSVTLNFWWVTHHIYECIPKVNVDEYVHISAYYSISNKIALPSSRHCRDRQFWHWYHHTHRMRDRDSVAAENHDWLREETEKSTLWYQTVSQILHTLTTSPDADEIADGIASEPTARPSSCTSCCSSNSRCFLRFFFIFFFLFFDICSSTWKTIPISTLYQKIIAKLTSRWTDDGAVLTALPDISMPNLPAITASSAICLICSCVIVT